MKNIIKIIGIITIYLVIGFTSCEDLNTTPDIPSLPAMSINKFEIEPSQFIENDKIKYSFNWEGYEFYYIHLGQVKHIPVFFHPAEFFGTTETFTYQFSTMTTESHTIRDIVSRSSQNAISVTDQRTRSTTNMQRLSTEINTKYSMSSTASAGIKGIASASVTTGFEFGLKVAAETSWNQHASDTIIGTVSETTSLTDTVEHAST